jgi:hypothetical protein
MVKEIQCAEGKIALVDDEDYPLLSRFTWSVVGTYPCFWHHIQRRANGSTHIQMHKLIMGGINLVDHKDGNHFNNQKDNLRPVTVQQNGWNSIKRNRTAGARPPSSQYKGVVKCIGVKERVYWRVLIRLTAKGVKPEKYVRLGPFDKEIDAAKAYNEEIVKHRGEYARLNQIPNPIEPKVEKTS